MENTAYVNRCTKEQWEAFTIEGQELKSVGVFSTEEEARKHDCVHHISRDIWVLVFVKNSNQVIDYYGPEGYPSKEAAIEAANKYNTGKSE